MSYNSPSALIDYLNQFSKKQTEFVTQRPTLGSLIPIKQRLRSQLDKIESNIHIGSCVLANKYTKSSGFLDAFLDTSLNKFTNSNSYYKLNSNENLCSNSAIISFGNFANRLKLKQRNLNEIKSGNNIIQSARSMISSSTGNRYENASFNPRSNFPIESILCLTSDAKRLKLQRSNTTMHLRKLNSTEYKIKSDRKLSKENFPNSMDRIFDENLLNEIDEANEANFDSNFKLNE